MATRQFSIDSMDTVACEFDLLIRCLSVLG